LVPSNHQELLQGATHVTKGSIRTRKALWTASAAHLDASKIRRASLVANSAATARLRWDWALCQRRTVAVSLGQSVRCTTFLASLAQKV